MKKNSDLFGPVKRQPGFLKWLLLRGVIGSITVMLLFEAYGRLPLGDANALTSNVVWTSVIGFIALGEKIHWVDISAIPINLAGILLLAQPSFLFGNGVNYTLSMQIGLATALLCGVSIALATVILRRLSRYVHHTVLLYWFSLINVFLCGAFLYFTDGFHLPCKVWIRKPFLFITSVQDELWAVFLCGPNSIICQSCLTLALQYEKAARVSIVATSQIVLAFLIQVFFLDEPTNIYSIAGASLGSFILVHFMQKNKI